MSTWQSVAAKRVGDLFNVYIVRKGRAGPMLEQDLLETILRRFAIDCVFDVGANEGQYAQMLRRVGYRGNIISFEPIPKLAAQLRRAAARESNWFVEELALDEHVRDVNFNVMLNDKFSSLAAPSQAATDLFADANVVSETIAVKTARLEDVMARYASKLSFSRPFLKMDTQGNDLAVARGAGSSLKRFVALQSELSIKPLYDRQASYRESIDFYEAEGFVLTGFVPNNAGHFPEMVEIDCIMYNPAVVGPLPQPESMFKQPKKSVSIYLTK
jgi:FkbM family methyltransferase